MQIGTIITLAWAAACYLFLVGWCRWNKRMESRTANT